MYHSSAVLLPDGRIVVGGGEAAGRLRAQIYSPPYLFGGARPVIAAAPTLAGYGGTFSVTTPDVASITSVALIRLNAAHPRLRREPALRPPALRAEPATT